MFVFGMVSLTRVNEFIYFLSMLSVKCPYVMSSGAISKAVNIYFEKRLLSPMCFSKLLGLCVCLHFLFSAICVVGQVLPSRS